MSQEKSESIPVSASVLPWQNGVIEQLLTLKRKKQLPHAVLIELQTGVDSRSFGWQLVTALLCERIEGDATPCGQCQHCQLMRANNYPDFTFTTLINNERTPRLNKDIKIDQIRRLIHQLTLTPNLQAGKIALIYPAEKMNQSSANSLLKTLEEPADEATLVLITHHANRLPITVRSRCQHWMVKNPHIELARSWLRDNGVDPDQIDAYLALSHQDAQMALQFYQQESLKHADEFEKLFKNFLHDRNSIVSLTGQVKQFPAQTLRLIVKKSLLSFIHQQLDDELTPDNKQVLGELLNLLKHADFVLQSEENNLNLQLQLEDVLISLKQILKREKYHAFS